MFIYAIDQAILIDFLYYFSMDIIEKSNITYTAVLDKHITKRQQQSRKSGP
jgi:hypothetical protein